ncbi:MAG: IclR family transcriptional regulator C-terminal domain-containing protein [Alphaproteobacteria bacterium]
MAATSSDDDTLQSLARGLAVLRALGAAADGLTIAEAARATDATRAAARRILLTLVALGYVRQQGRRFASTPLVLELGAGLYAGAPLWGVADAAVAELCARLGETVSVGLLDGTDVVYAVRRDPPRPVTLGIRAGFRLPAHASSMGWVLLAGLPEWQVEAFCRRGPFARLTALTTTDPAALAAGIAEAGRNGWAYLDSTAAEGVAGLSVPIADPTGRTLAALNVSTRVGRHGRAAALAELLPPLRDTATEIARLLGRAVPLPWRATPPGR